MLSIVCRVTSAFFVALYGTHGHEYHMWLTSTTPPCLASSSSNGDATTRNTSKTKSPIPPPPPLSLPVWSLAVPFVSSSVVHTITDEKPPSSLSSSFSPCYTSMNIVTFASAVSVAAPKYWMISLYYGTRTKEAFCDGSRQGVLQLLTPEQIELVPILGKRSGNEEGYSKADACREVGVPWVECRNLLSPTSQQNEKGTPPPLSLWLLPRCASYLHLRIQSTVDAGDHLVTICELLGTGEWDEEKQCVKMKRSSMTETAPPPVAMDDRNVLYTGLLRKEGVI